MSCTVCVGIGIVLGLMLAGMLILATDAVRAKQAASKR